MRHWSIVLVATAIMVLGFIATLVLFGDESRLKQLLIGQVEAQTGRQMTIDGSVSLRFFPRLRIEAEQIHLSGPSDFQGPELVSSDRMVADVRLLPLVRGRLETREMSFSGARLNLAMDSDGLHSLGGLMRRPGREGAPGMTASGPLRLEDVEIDLGGLLLAGPQQVQVDRIELDGLEFDRMLNLQFQGALGRPALIADARLEGRLFVPAETGQFRLADMRFIGRHAGGGQPFELHGALQFTAIPPLSMKLDPGYLRVNGQQLELTGGYEARTRPYFRLSARATELDLQALAAMLAPEAMSEWPIWVANAVAEHDFDLELAAAQLTWGAWRLPSFSMHILANEGDAMLNMAPTALPGAVLEIEASVHADANETLVLALAQLEIDDLGELLASLGSDLVASGAGRARIVPVSDSASDALAEAELEIFDGRMPGLSDLRRQAGLEAHDRFDHMQGRLRILKDAIVAPLLLIQDESSDIQVQAVWLRRSGFLQGTVSVADESGIQRFQLSGSTARPQFTKPDEAQTTQ